MLPKKRLSKFQDTWSKEFPSIKRGRNEHEAFCTVCNSGVSVSHGGKGDVLKHVATEKHRKSLPSIAKTPPVHGYFVEYITEAKAIAAAEGAFAVHSIKHHLSYNSASCSSKMFSKIFKDSKIACKFSSGKTKTEAVVNSVLAPYSLEIFKATMNKVNFFSFSTDASTKGYHKLFPVVVQYFDKEKGLQAGLIEFDELENETSITISNYLLPTVNTFDMSEKVVAFGGDNTNTNFGGIKGNEGNNVFSHLKKDLACGDNLIGVGCPAHVLHNTLHAGTDTLGVDVESIVMKIFYHFYMYTIRVNKLKEFCDFVSVSYQNLLQHSKTRWLSIFPAVEGILSLFEPLQSYFLSIENCLKVLKSFFENPLSKAYLYFTKSLSSAFHKSIQKIERESISVIEVTQILDSVAENLKERREQHFLSIVFEEILTTMDDNVKDLSFTIEMNSCYQASQNYLQKWSGSFMIFSCFKWMLLEDVPAWEGQVEEAFWLLVKEGS